MNQIKQVHKTPEGMAVIGAAISGLLTHGFALVNVMHNIDDIGEQPYGYGVGITSGRWLLSLLGDFFRALGGSCNLAFVNGVLFLALISVAAGFLVKVLKIKNRGSACLAGMLFAAFPTAASVLLYRFTSVYYGIAVVLAVLAAWVIERYRFGVLFSGVLTALSMGIYQAYVPITIGIFVLVLIRKALNGETDIKGLVRQGVGDCLALLLGLALYFLGLKLCLRLYGASLGAYRGMNEMGQLALGDIPGLIWQAFTSFCKFPMTDYCGLAGTKVIAMTYFLLGGVSLVMVGYILLAKVKKVGTAVCVLLLCLVFPVAVNFVVIMCPQTWTYTTMMYPFALVACVPLVLLECMPAEEGSGGKLLNKAVGLLLAVLICGYAYGTNVNYSAMYYINRQMENYVSSIVVQTRMTEGFDPEKKWAMLGTLEDPLLNSPWQYETTYGGTFSLKRMLNEKSRYYWFWNYVGYRIPEASEETIRELQNTAEVQAMPCWPSEGSIKVIGDTVVIKFGEQK